MMANLWYTHRRDSMVKKLLWSLVLCVPFVGWIFYGAFYTPLPENEIKASVNKDAISGGH